ncbi:MAG: tetratricopeptide repeat protein [Candidatus Omnitrophica bacterium]|nr:tetratricopeptide repeat protein [Candidatus Omnitrophota bacterium]
MLRNFFIIGSLIVIFSFSLFAQEISKEEEAIFVAQKAQEDGFYEVALDLYQRFLDNYPQSKKIPEVNLYIGQCYFFEKNYVEALKRFESLLNDPKAERIKDASLYWIGEVYFSKNDFNQAANYYKNIIDNFSQSLYVRSAYYSLGWCFYQTKDYLKALECFRKLKENYPTKDEFFLNATFKIMDCLYYLRDYQKLKEEVQSYLKINPKDKNLGLLTFYLAEANYYTGNFQLSYELYFKLIKEIDVEKRIKNLSKLGLGWSCIKMEKYKEAEEIFNQIENTSLDTKDKEIFLLGKATLLNKKQNFLDSLKVYDELSKKAEQLEVIIQAYLGKADSLYNLARYQEAIGIYKEAIDRLSKEEIFKEFQDKLYYNLAWSYLKAGLFKEAINEFQKIASSSEDKMIKVSSLCLAADAYQDSGSYDKAIEVYSEILKNYPNTLYSDYIQYQIGLSYLRKQDYDSAILCFKNLLINFPNSQLLDEANYALALTYFQKEDYPKTAEVLSSFKDKFKDSPLRAEALYLYGSSLYNIEKFSEAIEIFKEITRDFTQNKELVQKAEYEIADCYYRLGNQEEAVSRFNLLRVKYPESSFTSEVLWWLGAYYYQKGNLSLAKRYFENLIQNFPQSNLISDAYYALGSIYEEENNFEIAISNFQKTREIAEPDLAGQATIAIADILLKKSSYPEAIKIYLEIIKEYPGLAGLVYPKLAEAYRLSGNLKEAVNFYRKALGSSPSKQLGALQFKIAECLEEEKNFQEAIEEYLKVSYLYPEDEVLVARALIRVAQIYEDKGELKEALNIYDKVISLGVQEAKYAQERIEYLKKSLKY